MAFPPHPQNKKTSTTSMPDPLILAIDNGTQSVRALLFDLRGDIVAKSQVHLQA